MAQGGRGQAVTQADLREPVPGTPYTVGAGVYDDTRSLTDLEKMSGG